MLRFDGRVAIVTGAGKGLGRAYAEWLGARGACIVVNDKAHVDIASTATEVADAIIAKGGRAVANHNAVESEGAGEAMVRAAMDHFGRLDILIANAADNVRGPVAELYPLEFRRNMEINFWGSVGPVLAAMTQFMAQNYGRIVLTSSAAGLFGQKDHAPYASAKGAITGFGRALAIENSERDIRVNMISPYARTQMSQHVIPEALSELMAPDKVASVVGWLAHESCSVTGQILSAGAGRVRRVGIVEGSVVEIKGEALGRQWDELADLSGALESRNSAQSALGLIPELMQRRPKTKTYKEKLA